MATRNIAVLGSTGSIGRQTLDVAREMGPERVRVRALSARSNAHLLYEQVLEWRPDVVSLEAGEFPGMVPLGTKVAGGESAMVDIVTQSEVDLVVVGTTGSAGLLPTLAALRAGKLVALANKETLVMAGPLIRKELKEGRGELVPIDSEHSAIWQCLQGESQRSVERLTLTASGGALRSLSQKALDSVTPEQALQHPTWSMGPKITIDSANLMNKGLEIIEACWLFDLPIDRIDVVLHAQSIIHSLVTFTDSSTKAQLGWPDMRLPIQYALSHPERWQNSMPRLDLAEVGRLDFDRVDMGRYPCLGLAIHAGRKGGTCPAVLSASDEVAVDAFLRHRIRFTDIPMIVERTLSHHTYCESPELDDILESDTWARQTAEALVAQA